jgi:AcrR family transcriptional regulator
MWALSTSTRDQPYHHGELRQVLLEAAEALLRRDGAGRLSLREVARAAGVSHNAPYRHFPTRETLLAALATDGFRRLAAALRAGQGAAHGPAALVPLGRAYLRFADSNPALYRLMFSDGPRKSDHPALAEAAHAAFAPLAEALPERGAAVGAWALVHGLAELLRDGQISADLMGPALAEAVIGRYAGQGRQAR